jgi:hypothetical protein
MGRNQIIADRLLGVHQQQYQLRTNFNPKKICLIYKIVRKDREEQKMELKNSQFQEPFIPMDRRSRGSRISSLFSSTKFKKFFKIFILRFR